MPINLKELNLFLAALFPSVTDYCPNGLQVEGKSKISSIGTAVSASLQTIEEAVDRGVDALIVHHGLFWQKDSYVIEGSKQKKLKLLLENEISLFGFHLPLDLHQELGNNWKAALDMGWTHLKPFGVYNGFAIGVQGRVKKASQKEFQRKLESYYEHDAVCATGGPKNIVSAALVSGGAYKMIPEAAQAGVDAFITGNFDEPAWHQAFEEKINFFALGHSATERIGPKALATHLKKHVLSNTVFIDVPNPF